MKLSLTPLKIFCILVLLALSALALTGGVDKLANGNLDGALATTGAIYATARGINALVSVLQGTELDLPFVTFAIGEVLDPVNDLIERFSTVVLFALGAIAAQKVLLLLVSSSIFNYVFSGIAVLTGLGIVTLQARTFAPLLKTFLIVAFVRFALGLVVIANSWVDAALLDPIDKQRHESMQTFESDLRTVKDIATNQSDFSELAKRTQGQIDALNALIETGAGKLSDKELEISDARARLAQQLEGEDTVCRFSVKAPVASPTCSDTTKSHFQELRMREQEKVDIEERITGYQEKLEDQRANLECINKRTRGEACTVWDRIPDAPDIGVIQSKLNGLDSKLDDFTENAWLLLISVLLKSVAIPLLFFYALLRCTGMIWRTDFEKLLGNPA
ncbi:hypothetical protein [Haliea sp. E17]|uniref:hypothetical protein n=1 Tax=Haliea sp. E17 TaxID=3401576 RepID=UPI003AAA96C3